MPPVLTQASLVTCGHAPGKAAAVGTPTLTVAGSPVLLAAGVVGAAVAGCSTATVTGPPPSKPCLTVLTVTPGPSLSTKLLVNGAPVLLATLAGTTDGVIAGVTPQVLLAASGAPPLLTAT